MEKIDFKKEALLWIFLLAPLVYLAMVWNSLPSEVPIHFDAVGRPNGYGGKIMEFVLPAVNIFVYFFILFIRKIDPKKLSEGFFSSNMYKLRVALTVFLSVITVVVIYAGMPGNTNAASKWIPALVFFFIAVLGNFMINIKPNWFIGIRTPWTLSNDEVWRKTHQAGGRMFFYGGLICGVLSLFLPDNLFNQQVKLIDAVVVVFFVGTVLFLFGYSFWLFKQQQVEDTRKGTLK